MRVNIRIVLFLILGKCELVSPDYEVSGSRLRRFITAAGSWPPRTPGVRLLGRPPLMFTLLGPLLPQ